jgi:hypothetical protein
VITLRNGSSEAAGYNLCSSTLQQRSGTEWTPVPSDRVCTMELRTLEPGAEDTFTLNLPTDLASGDYRFSTGIERLSSGDRVDLATEPFVVG